MQLCALCATVNFDRKDDQLIMIIIVFMSMITILSMIATMIEACLSSLHATVCNCVLPLQLSTLTRVEKDYHDYHHIDDHDYDHIHDPEY